MSLLLFLLLWGGPVMPAAARMPAGGEPTASAEAPKDPFGRENPRTMQIGLLRALAQRDDARLAHFLQLSNPASDAAIARATAFREILDEQGSLLPRIALSLDPAGTLEDGLPPDEEEIGNLEIEGETVPVVARRVEGKEAGQIWLVSAATLAHIPTPPPASAKTAADAAEVARGTPIIILGLPIGRWILFFIGGLILHVIIAFPLRLSYRRIRRRYDGHPPVAIRLAWAFIPPLILMLIFIGIRPFAIAADAGLAERTAMTRFSDILLWGTLAWLAWRMIGVASDLLARRLRIVGEPENIGIVKFVARILRVAMLVILFALLLATTGVDVTAGLAALGIGGLALALGARKAVEDLVGGVMVLMDRPVSIGDRCKVKGRVGDVVDIGIRSTRIRTRERSLLIIPNSQFADSEIENLAVRDTFFVDQTLGLTFDAGPGRVEQVLAIMRAVFEADPDHVPEVCPIRFLGFGDGQYLFQIHAYLRCPTHTEGYLAQERLLLALLRRFDEAGITVAPPVRRIEMIEDSPGIDRVSPSTPSVQTPISPPEGRG